MNKKGQYFLLAALILSTVLFSIGTIFNTAVSVPEDKTSKELAGEMSYEASELLAHDFLQGFSFRAESDLLSLSDYYASNHKDAEIIIIYGMPDSIKARYYINGESSDFASNITLSPPNLITIGYNEESYKFIKHNGYNYFVIVKTEDAYGKFITAK